ncbi:hypothetical protein [Paraburkholderia saeva]|uniref:hypothetical protein n=1 Tax=Paraburkholderia saeva TaxID=2777537 RepID=UPI001E301688|nr:hypothetical protein [Paraburkholderia saeva]
MIGVFVTFRYGDNFDERAVRKIAETARGKFEVMPGLRSKAFTFNSGKREATNFYVWESEDAAKAFFTDELLDRVTGLYGVRPDVEFVQIAALVENAPQSHRPRVSPSARRTGASPCPRPARMRRGRRPGRPAETGIAARAVTWRGHTTGLC